MSRNSSSGGSGFGALVLLGIVGVIVSLILRYIGPILGLLAIAAAIYGARAIVRDNRRRRQDYDDYCAEVAAKADKQDEWVRQGDMRGVFGPDAADLERETIVLEVNGKRVAVTMPAGLGATSAAPAKGAGPAKRSAKKAAGTASGDSLTAPMQGTIVKVEVSEGDVVAVGDLIVVLEAMKMEQPLTAHKAGTVTGLTAEKGATVSSGTILCEIKDS